MSSSSTITMKSGASNSPSTTTSTSGFPSEGLLPKAETEVTQFLQANPSYDGRNVRVAIFDTGCDPGASGMRVTSTGANKFVDFLDASGSGDVFTSTVITSQSGGDDGLVRFVSPLSQRELLIKVSSSTPNPRGIWHVGVKRAYEMYPAPLVERMKKERKRVFEQQQRQLEQELQKRIAEWDSTPAAATKEDASSSSPSSYPITRTAKDKADLEARLSEAKSLASKLTSEDVGPVFDVVTWHTGTPLSEGEKNDVEREKGWYVMIDSTCTGDFRAALALTNYRDVPQYGTFSGVDLMNYTVNIYGSGKVVSIVTTAGSHGSHVAGIVGAYEGATPEQQQHNGIAPGAQFVSIKIGDSRLGSMETGVGLVRGLIEAIRAKVDIINMSYGEASSIPNSGRISELIRSAIFDHGIVFVSSAGNNGPALSSSGSPGGTDNGVISVGAYVSPAMSVSCYSSRTATKENQYSWSSRGPTLDGAAGVTISACGGAVTSVCTWQLQKSQLMNGTSMSSPAAAGGIALLLSGLKARGIKYTPARIKAAIENTARLVPDLDTNTQGCGLLQVQRAFEHLVANADRPELDLLYRVTLPATNARGIYLREASEANRAYEASVNVEAVFRDETIGEAKVATATAASEEKKDTASDASTLPPGLAHPSNYSLNVSRVQFEQKLALVCSAPWVVAPKFLILHHGGRAFTTIVHGEQLKESGVYSTEILGFDTKYPQSEWESRGPVFRVPITVVKVEDAQLHRNALIAQHVQGGGTDEGAAVVLPAGVQYQFKNLPCDSGIVHRRFVTIPEGASYVDFTINAHSFRAGSGSSKDAAADPSRGFMFHALYLQPEKSFDANEVNSFFNLTQDAPTKELRLDVRPGATLEVCLTQYWSSLGGCQADVDVQFFGVDSDREVTMDASEGFKAVPFRSVLRTTKLAPSASLKQLNSVIKPSSAVVTPLTKERDYIVKDGKLSYHLLLTYNFELKEDSSSVHLRAPQLNDRLYESIYESQLTSIFDTNKRHLFTTDAFEHGKALKQGKYIAKLQVRHEDAALLEKLKDMMAVVEVALAKSIDLACYSTYPSAASSGAKFPANKLLKAGKSSLVYLGVDPKSFPSFSKPGDYASGTMYLTKNEGSLEKGGGVVVKVYAPAAAAPPEAKASEAKPTGDKLAPTKKEEEKKSEKPAEGEADPAFPKLEQRDPSSPQASPAPVASSSTPAPSSAPAPASVVPASPQPSSLAVELRDLTIVHLTKLKVSDNDAAARATKTEALNVILPPLIAQFPSHLPLLYLDLRFTHELAATRAEYKQVDAKIDALLTKHIDQTAVLAHFGRLIPADDTAAQAQRKSLEEVKKTVIKVLIIKLELAMKKLRVFKEEVKKVEYQPSVLKELDAPSAASEEPIIDASTTTYDAVLKEYNAVWSEISSWIDVNSKEGKTQFATYQAFQYKLQKSYGVLLKALNADITAATADGGSVLQKLYQDRLDLLSFLAQKEGGALWQHLVQAEKDALVTRFPKEFNL